MSKLKAFITLGMKPSFSWQLLKKAAMDGLSRAGRRFRAMISAVIAVAGCAFVRCGARRGRARFAAPSCRSVTVLPATVFVALGTVFLLMAATRTYTPWGQPS